MIHKLIGVMDTKDCILEKTMRASESLVSDNIKISYIFLTDRVILVVSTLALGFTCTAIHWFEKVGTEMDCMTSHSPHYT